MRFASFLLLTTTAMAQSIDLTKPPATPPLAPYKLPAVHETRLPNGLAIVLVEDARFPLVTVRLGFNAGDRYDPAGKTGLTETVGALLREGTAKRKAREIADELAAIGGDLNANTSADGVVIAGNVLSENLPKLMDLLADITRYSTFPEDELALRKQNRAQELELERSQSETLADERVHQVVFGSHPYSRTLPTPESIAAIQRADLTGYRDSLLVPNNAVLVMVGALPARAETMKLITARFGDWQSKKLPAVPGGEIPKPKRSITLIDRPGSAQVDVQVAHASVNRQNPDHFPLVVGANILGGGTSSRLFVNIREKQGFAYSVYAHHAPIKDAGLFVAVTQVRDEVLEPAMKSLLGELDGMAKAPVTSAELTNTKNYLNGNFVMQVANQGGLASQIASSKLNGVGVGYIETYVTKIRSVEPDQIEKVAGKYIAPADSAIVVVGDASKIGPTVKKFGEVKIEKAK